MSARLLVLALVLCLPVAPLHAQSLKDSAARQVAHLIVSQDQARDNGKIEWDLRVQAARNRSTTGKRLLIGGLAAAGVGWLVMSGDDQCDSFTCPQLLSGLLILGGGGGVATVGWIRWSSATGNLELLEREGRLKGFLTIAPTRNGVQAVATLTF